LSIAANEALDPVDEEEDEDGEAMSNDSSSKEITPPRCMSLKNFKIQKMLNIKSIKTKKN
jgi:hypothetical protein